VLSVLDRAGYLVYIHAAAAVIEKGGEKVLVHGLGGVPEKMARNALKAWAPKPLQGARNILVLHQSINEFLPVNDAMASNLSLEDLPKGFDMIIDGHLHWTSSTNLGGTVFLLCGSTIMTQMKRLEGEQEKGVHVLDTASMKTEFIPLPSQRKLFYRKLAFKGAKPQEVIESVEKEIREAVSANGDGLVPLVRLKLTGSLAKGIAQSDIDIPKATLQFRGKAILSVSKEFEATGFRHKIAELREKAGQKKSVAALGVELLEKNLEETDFGKSFDARRVFELLAEGETEKVLELLSGESG